jgi:hypothetical protein
LQEGAAIQEPNEDGGGVSEKVKLRFMNPKPVILLAFANDPGRFMGELTREMKSLDKILRRQFLIQLQPAAEKKDIEELFQIYGQEIRVFHYGGHAGPEGIETAPTEDVPKLTFARGLAEFIGLQKGVRLIFLNGCATEKQVEHFHRSHIPCVIATTRPVQDRMARLFAEGFYRSLASGKCIEDAFHEGRASARGHFERDEDMTTRGFDRLAKESTGDDFPYKLLVDKRWSEAGKETIKDWTPPPLKPKKENGEEAIIPLPKPKGERTYLLCNRGEHNDAFEDPVQQVLKAPTRRPRFFLLHGPYEERPDSLADRFYEFTVRDILHRLKEPVSPGKYHRVEMKFPTARDFNSRQNQKKAFYSLQKHFSNADLDLPEAGLQVVQKLGYKRRIVLLQHNLMAADWHADMPEFIRWYFTEFWQLTLNPRQPQIVVVLNLTYHLDKGLGGLLKKRKDRQIENALEKLAEEIEDCFFIERLRQVSRNEVGEWQRDYLPHEDELIDQIFGRSNQLSMGKIEPGLRHGLKKYADQNE